MNIQRLNMDNSWCIDFAGQTILIDPWLQGVEIDYFPWFNMQWHKTKPVALSEVPDFDMVLITQKYPDHFHPETLIALAPKKLIVPKSIEKKVRQLLPNAEVVVFNTTIQHAFGSDINSHFLPTSRKIDPIYDALLLENGEESVLLATHGYTEIEAWTEFIKTMPPVKLVLTPFNTYQLPFYLGGTVSPGLEAVKNLIHVVNPQCIIATHDEDKHAKGFVHKMAKITFPPNKEALLKDEAFKNRLLQIDDYGSYTI
jgi:L-ascorbate metabolism protein UlaG (beta-lactamase superfamily)